MKGTKDDEIMQALRHIETAFSGSEWWRHEKGWNDVKTTFRDALAICQDLREWHLQTGASQTKDLPGGPRDYMAKKAIKVLEALGYAVVATQREDEGG